MKLSHITTLFVVGAAALSTSIAVAQQGPDLKGKGSFMAQGRGMAELKGSGVFSVTGNGEVAVIAGRQDDIKVKGFGFERKDGNVYYYRGAGTIATKGREVGIKIVGEVKELKGAGAGTALLKGEGKYRVKGSQGQWNRDGVNLKFGPDKAP